MLEKTQELIKEEGKDDTELRDFAARFDRLDTTVQLQQGAGSLETAQLESRAAVETKDEEAAKRGASQMCGTLTKRTSRHDVREKLHPNNEANNEVYLVETARSADGSSLREVQVGLTKMLHWMETR